MNSNLPLLEVKNLHVSINENEILKDLHKADRVQLLQLSTYRCFYSILDNDIPVCWHVDQVRIIMSLRAVTPGYIQH